MAWTPTFADRPASASASAARTRTRKTAINLKSATFLLVAALSASALASGPPAEHTLPRNQNHYDVVGPAAAAAAPPPGPEHVHLQSNRNHVDEAVHRQRDDAQQQQKQQQQQEPASAYTPLVTPGPGSVPDDQALRDQGFRQETFYACRTAPSGKEHCGWHTPVLKAKHGSAAAVPGRATDMGIVVAVVAGFAGVFVVGMM